MRVRPGAKLPAPDGDERATIFACRNVLWEITITMKSLYLWEFYKCSQKQFLYVGRREAHRWGYALSAFSHSTPCPLGRSETRAKAALTGPSLNLREVSSQRTGLRARADWAGDAMRPRP